MLKVHRNLLVLALTALVLAVAGVATAATAATAHRGPKAPRILAAAVHADVRAIFEDKTTRSQSWDKGEVTAVSSTSITLKRRDNQSVTLSIDSSTKIRARGGKVEVGAKALVVSQAGKAVAILAAKPRGGERKPNDRGRGPGPAPGLAGKAVHVDWSLIMADGKTASLALDKGEVTAASSTSFTLKRKDGVSVTLTTDSNTRVLKRQRAAIATGDKALAWSQAGKATLVLAGAPKQR
jgi:hypothetical protein